MHNRDLFPAATVDAKAHAETDWPNEAVGIATTDGEYVPLANIHPDPANGFEVTAHDRIEYADRVACVFHSHCHTADDFDPESFGPSSGDMEMAEEWGCPWAVIACIDRSAGDPLFFGDFRLDEPLLGRPFVPQVLDCYELIRSAYRQWFRIALPSFPRDWDWWSNGMDMYTDGFAKAGFRRIDIGEAAPGDVLLAQIPESSPVPNHAGLLLEGGRILHHRQGKLSKRDSIGAWARSNYFVGALRHQAFGDRPPPAFREPEDTTPEDPAP